jgi:hypothetical protein
VALPAGWLIGTSVWDDGRMVGVGMLGRPVARHMSDGVTAEITRVATCGTPNACSMIYGALRRAGVAVGYGLADICAPLHGLTEVAQSAGWWWAHRGFAVVSDRPATLHDEPFGSRRRLHNPHGPSVTYRDGWSCWHWRGLSVPRWVIEEPTVERIMTEPNVEVRRAAIESYGWDRLLDHMTLVDHDDDPHRGDLYDPPAIWIDSDRPAPIRVLIVRNGTPAPDGSWPLYGLTVPAVVDTVSRAQDWLAGVDGLVLARRT